MLYQSVLLETILTNFPLLAQNLIKNAWILYKENNCTILTRINFLTSQSKIPLTQHANQMTEKVFNNIQLYLYKINRIESKSRQKFLKKI